MYSDMIRIDDSGGRTKCWLTRDELDALERAAGRGDWQREIAIELMGRYGLRAHEVPYPGDGNLRWSDDGEIWLVEIQGKNTKGGQRKTRDAWVPESVADDLHKYSRERELAASDSWVDRSTATVRRRVADAAEQLAEERDNERWRHVTSHDLRRSWATFWLVEEAADVRTMMAIGGWSDYSAIEPYLDEPTESRIGQVMG